MELIPPRVPPGLPVFAKGDQELRYLVERVFVNLARLGYPDVRYPVAGEARGRLDLAGFTTSRALVLAVEGKALQELGMRGTADDVAGAYNRCEGDSFLNQAQLFAGMMGNDLVCGMATSSQMSYFFQCSDGRVRVAGPFMVAQPGYIRAVAWFLQYAEQRARDRAAGRDPFVWPRDECREKAARDPSRVAVAERPNSCLELVPISAELLRTGRFLGHGRHGDVYSIVWGSELVAVKYFAEGEIDSFLLEVAMYRRLAPLQGLFIPHLIFVGTGLTSRDRTLGLQVGKPMPDSFDAWSNEQLAMLRETEAALQKVGYAQTDMAGRNFVLLKGDDGRERVAVVDLESLRSLAAM